MSAPRTRIIGLHRAKWRLMLVFVQPCDQSTSLVSNSTCSDSRPVPESSVPGFGWRRSRATFCANLPSSSRRMPSGVPVCVMSSRVCSGDGIVIEMRERDPARAAMVGPVTTNAGDSTAPGQRVTRTNPQGICADFRGQRLLRRRKPRRNSSGSLSAGAGEDLMSSS